jgi:membrane fusion protein, heavy metal efflux system
MKNPITPYILLFVITACSTPPKKDNADENINAHLQEVVLNAEQYKSLNIELGLPQKKGIGDAIEVTGMLDVPPQNLVTISAPLGGFVKSTELLQGMRVKKGQLIVTLEHPDYIQLQEDYLLTKNQLEFLELEYKRQEELSKENVNSAKSLQLSKSNFFSAKAKMQGLTAKLKLVNINIQDLENGEIKNSISIPSPLSGYVTQVNVNLGMRVTPTDILFKIIDTEHLHAEAQVFEKDLPALKVGQRVRLFLSNETKERQAKVFLIGKEISAERTVRVHCHLEEEDLSLIPGLYFKAVIESETTLVDALPAEAIVEFDNAHFVFVENQALQYTLAEIEIGKTQNGFTQVNLPLAIAKKNIVINGTYSLLSILKNTEED